MSNNEGKNRIVAGILAFVAPSGVYNFYLGYTKKGIIQLSFWILGMSTILAGSIMSIWGITSIGPGYSDLLIFTLGMIVMVVGSYILAGFGIWDLVDGVRLFSCNLNQDGKGRQLTGYNKKA